MAEICSYAQNFEDVMLSRALAHVRDREQFTLGATLLGLAVVWLVTVNGMDSRQGLHVTDAERPVVERWVRAGWAELHGDRIRLTPSGWLRLDALAVALTSQRSR